MLQSRKKRIVIVENNLFIGGVQRLVIEQLSVLTPDEYETTLVVLTQHTRANMYHLIPEYVDVHTLDFKGMVDVRGWYALARLLSDLKPDLVKTTTYFSNTIVRLLRFFLGRYIVVAAEHNTKQAKTYIQRVINRMLSRVSVTTVVDSQLVAEYLSKSENVPIARYTIVHNGADLERIERYQESNREKRAAMRNKFGVTENQILFVNVARLVEQKNHMRLLHAFSAAMQERKDIKLIVVGEGPKREEMERFISDKDLGGRVCLVGERTDIDVFYFISDFGILSSDHEGFCIAGIESMAHHRPFISTRVGGVSEYVQQGVNGFVTSHSVEDMTRHIHAAASLSDAERTSMSAEAYITACCYSARRYRLRIKEIFDEYIKQNLRVVDIK